MYKFGGRERDEEEFKYIDWNARVLVEILVEKLKSENRGKFRGVEIEFCKFEIYETKNLG